MSTMTNLLTGVEDLLLKKDVNYEKEEKCIYFVIAVEDDDAYEMKFFSFENDQIILFSDYGEKIPEDKRLIVIEFIVRINNMFPLGDFEMFIDEGFVQYKISNILKGAMLSEEILDEMVNDALFAMDISHPGFMAICNEGKSALEAFTIVESGLMNKYQVM